MLQGALAVVGAALLAWGLWPQPVRVHAGAPGNGWESTFRAPLAIRRGEQAEARLTLKPAAQSTPAPLHLEARLTVNGLAMQPQGTLTLTLASPQTATLTWQLHGDSPGAHQGTLWLYRLQPNGSRQPVATYPLRVEVRSLGGLSGTQARLLGVLALGSAALGWVLRRSGQRQPPISQVSAN